MEDSLPAPAVTYTLECHVRKFSYTLVKLPESQVTSHIYNRRDLPILKVELLKFRLILYVIDNTRPLFEVQSYLLNRRAARVQLSYRNESSGRKGESFGKSD